MRHAARRDANEPAIVATLEALGAPYRLIACPEIGDLIAIKDGVPYFVEVKDGNKPYTAGQKRYREWLACHGVNLTEHAPTWRSVDDVFDGLGVAR